MNFDLSHVQWGPVSAWTGTLLTVGTLYMSLRLYRRDWRDRRRDQAKKFNAWVAEVSPKSGTIKVEALNTSDAPVYDVHINVLVLFNKRPFCYKWYGTFNPHTFPPGKDPKVYTLNPKIPLPEEVVNPPLSIPRAVTELTFTDTAGSKWSRSPDGRLGETKRKVSMRRFLMRRYGMWPPFDKRDKWWIKLLGELFFPHRTLTYDRDSTWRYVKTPRWVIEQEEELFRDRFLKRSPTNDSPPEKHGTTEN